MSIPALIDGQLPLGRYPAAVQDVEAAFVTGRSRRRREVWDDWIELTAALREVVGVLPAAWLGGSFLTDKEEPGDVDSVYLVEWSALLAARTDPRQAQLLEAVSRSLVKSTFGLSVDSFILEWVPTPGTTRPPNAERYLRDRGYWDNLWSRGRSADLRQDALPRRGYLEVILDGYN